MTLPVWPPGLEHRSILGAGGIESPYQEGVVTEFEDGPPRIRNQSQTGIRTLAYAINLRCSGDMARFDQFATVTLDKGRSHFMMDIGFAGQPTRLRRCFLQGGRWSAKPVGGGVHQVSFTLCVFLS